MERKLLNNDASYVLIQSQMSRHQLAQYGSISVELTHRETPTPLGCDPEVVKTHADAICIGPRSKEVKWYGKDKRRKGKQGMEQLSYVRNCTTQ